MSATYENARETLDAARTDLDAAAEGADPIAFAAATATVGVGEAILALAEEVEAAVELLRERLTAPPGVEYFADGPRPATTSPAPPDPGVRYR